jgi:hypothetical protein
LHRAQAEFTPLLCAALALFLPAWGARAAVNIVVGPGQNIQIACDRAATAGGGTIRLQNGVYPVRGAISLHSNTHLTGAGVGQTVLQGPATGYTWPLIAVIGNQIHDVTIENLTIDGNIDKRWANDPANPYVDQAGIRWFSPAFAASGGFAVNQVEVMNCSVGMSAANVDGLTVSGCLVHDCGMWVRPNLWQHDLYFNACSHVVIDHSQFYNSWEGSGIHLDSTTGDGSGWTITDCPNISGNAELGINIQNNVPGIMVKNNVISNNGFGEVYATNQYAWDGLAYGSNAAGGVISGNRSDRNKGFGIRILAGSGTLSFNRAVGNKAGNYQVPAAWKQNGNN